MRRRFQLTNRGHAHFPQVRVELSSGRVRTPQLLACVDTGASATLVADQVAHVDLEWSRQKIMSGKALTVGGLGSTNTTTAYGFQMDLSIGVGGTKLLLSNAWIYFSAGLPLSGWQVLLGQTDFLARTGFVQRYTGARVGGPFFILD